MKTLGPVPKTLISLLILAGGVVGFLLMGTPNVPTRPPSRGDTQMVRTVSAIDHTEGIEFDVDGVVVPYRQIEIAAQVSGRIAFKSDECRTGRAVKQGDLLVRIDQSDYKLEVTRLSEELKQADAMIKELKLETVSAENQIELTRQQLEIDTRQLDRNRRLTTTAAASQAELDNARRAELATRNTIQSLQDNRNVLIQRLVRMESEMALVDANLQTAQLALERTEIRAPLDGVIVRENVEQDGYIQAGNTVISLQDTSQLDVTCKLYMRQMHWLWQSDRPPAAPIESNLEVESSPNGELILEVAPMVDAYDFPETPVTVIYQLGNASYEWSGVLNRYDGAGIDNQTRMVPCRANVADPTTLLLRGDPDRIDGDTKPPTLMTGMFVKVRVKAKPPIPLARVPQEAIQPGSEVWTVVDGKLHRNQIRVATSDDEYVVAYQEANGLSAGDRVVVSPLATPIEGLTVKEAPKQ